MVQTQPTSSSSSTSSRSIGRRWQRLRGRLGANPAQWGSGLRYGRRSRRSPGACRPTPRATTSSTLGTRARSMTVAFGWLYRHRRGVACRRVCAHTSISTQSQSTDPPPTNPAHKPAQPPPAGAAENDPSRRTASWWRATGPSGSPFPSSAPVRFAVSTCKCWRSHALVGSLPHPFTRTYTPSTKILTRSGRALPAHRLLGPGQRL